jgi:hypothetical protein
MWRAGNKRDAIPNLFGNNFLKVVSKDHRGGPHKLLSWGGICSAAEWMISEEIQVGF